MKYVLKNYDGDELDNLTPEQAKKLADVAMLIELDVDGVTHYISSKSIASILPSKKKAWASDKVAKLKANNQ